MAVIHTYPTDTNLSNNDLLLGADGDNENITKKYTLGALATFIANSDSVVDTNFYLDGVTADSSTGIITFSMTGQDDITLDLGTSIFKDTSYFATADHTHTVSDILDENDITPYYLNVSGNGTSGQLLTSNGSGGFTWVDQSSFITDNNYYLDGISKSGNVLTFSVNGASPIPFTFGAGAFLSVAEIIDEVEAGLDVSQITDDLGDLATENLVTAGLIQKNAVITDKILDENIIESKLKISNSPTSGYVLTSDGSDGFTWAFNSASNYYVNNIAKSGNKLTFEVAGGLDSADYPSYTFGGGAFKDVATATGRESTKLAPAHHTHVMAHITGAGALATRSNVDEAQIADRAVTAAKLSPAAVGTNGQVLVLNSSNELAWATLSANVVNFLALGDTPSEFGTAGQIVKINSTADELEFVDFEVGRTDIDTTNTGTSGKVLAVDSNGDLEWADASASLAAGSINESYLDVTNDPVNNYILSYDSNSGGFTWIENRTGDITGITAGDGLTGTDENGPIPTINVAAATNGGINVNANDIELDFNDLSDGTVNTSNDSFAFIDADDSNKTKKESIADFLTSISGTNLTYDSGTGVINATSYTLPEATSTTKGGIELFSDTVQTVAANTVTATASRTYGIQLNSAGQAVVNVPWVDTNTDTNTFRTVTAGGNTLGASETLAFTAGSNITITEDGGAVTISSTGASYSLPEATSTVRGGIELFSDTDQSVAANAVSSTANRTYGIQLNSDGQAVVNVPWVNTTYSVGDGGLTQKNFTTALDTKLEGIEALADVTDATNVTSSLVSATSISSGDKTTIQSNLGVDAAGTDNSTDVTLATVTDNYLTIDGQEITAGTVPVSLGGTGATNASAARTALGLGNVENTALSTYTGENGALDNQYIANGAGYTTNTGTVDTSGTPVDNDFAKFTDANTIEGRSISEVKSDLSLENVTNESKVTMFDGPAFTGDATFDTDTLAIDSTNDRVGIGTTSPDVALDISSTDAVQMPSGTTAQRPTAAAGMLRYNSTTSEFEGYTTEWGSIGGASENTINVTVAQVSGSNKFHIDGTAQVALILIPGQKYIIDQSDSSNAGHPLKFSTTEDGTHGGGTEYTTGVIVSGTAGQSGAKVEITLEQDSPVLYYYCANHSEMGGKVQNLRGAGATIAVKRFSGDGDTATFDLENSVKNNDSKFIQVFIDGVYQSDDNYSVSGTTITFTTEPPTGTDNIEVVHFRDVVVTDIDDNAVTTAKIASEAVTSDKIAEDAVDTDQIVNSAVTNAKIAENAVDHDELANRYTEDVSIDDLDGIVSFDMSSGSVFKLSGDITDTYTIDLTGYKKGQIATIYPIKGNETLNLDAQGTNSNTFNKLGGVDYEDNGTDSNILQIECVDDSSTDPVFFYSITTYASDSSDI